MNPKGAELRRALKDPFDKESIERMWRLIAVSRRRDPGRRLRNRLVGGFVLAAAAGALVVLRLPGKHGATALRLDDGSPIGALATRDASRTFELSDHSHVELAQGAYLRPEVNTGAAFVVRLDKGAATFDVVPGGTRRWSVACGHVSVDVIGTRFNVSAAAGGQVRVGVEHGIVVVRGDHVPAGVQRLMDGQSIVIDDSAPVPPSSAGAAVAPPPPSPSALASAQHAGPTEPTPARASWQTLASRGSYDEAYQSLGADGMAHETRTHGSVDDLLALADVARLSGHGADAVLPLTRVVDEHPNEARAPLAAFTLGRLQLDTLGHPARAAEAFERAIALGLPQGLVEDAYARLVEAQARSGDRVAARATADAYSQRFPQGSRTSTIARWLGDD